MCYVYFSVGCIPHALRKGKYKIAGGEWETQSDNRCPGGSRKSGPVYYSDYISIYIATRNRYIPSSTRLNGVVIILYNVRQNPDCEIMFWPLPFGDIWEWYIDMGCVSAPRFGAYLTEFESSAMCLLTPYKSPYDKVWCLLTDNLP
jgi:hypothetical protein